ncbi:hemerythrin domain-containing protein [Candidatus Hecatella orcuttiae]|uniref:hemerythrin domain-containing protein n=1 Tax=Candidatus Hecatella orcuttiae TaxID=1935119 RepID=UPI002867E680|nr:hemerythrin domain-containing protein [Candidatus Hecatella orcuttiae]
MAGSSLVEVLEEEHRVIERMLEVLKKAAARLSEGEPVQPSLLKDALDFLRTFADRCHHGKEEDVLFSALQEHGFSAVEAVGHIGVMPSAEIGVMLSEHEEGRRLIRAAAKSLQKYEGGDAPARKALAKSLQSYIRLLTEHIFKEDSFIFPVADRLIPDAEKKQLRRRFEEAEKKIGVNLHQRYLRLVEKLENELGK